ncbi:MAG TPA: NADH-quinone oxidoreductase subunit C [Planctomycetota bacterium]|nr:NADH-quinone oxidoreductase subunit C [Planctomycetota bacterium]
MNEATLHARLAGSGVAGIGALDTSAKDPFVVVEADTLLAALAFLRDDPQCRMEMLHNVTAVERPEAMEVVYHVCSLTHHHSLTVKVRVPRPEGGTHASWIPEVPSVAGLWAAANWHEREQWDLLGVRFTGHPDLRRILLPQEWIGHPLRKDYVYPTEHGGMPLELDAVPLYERRAGDPAPEPKPPREAGTPLFQPPAPFSTRPEAAGGKTAEPGQGGGEH